MKAIVKYTAIFILALGVCYLWYCVGGVLVDGNEKIAWCISYRLSPVSFYMSIAFMLASTFLYIRKMTKALGKAK